MGGLIGGFVFGMAASPASRSCPVHATGHPIVISGVWALLLFALLAFAVGWLMYQNIRDDLMERRAQRRSGGALF